MTMVILFARMKVDAQEVLLAVMVYKLLNALALI